MVVIVVEASADTSSCEHEDGTSYHVLKTWIAIRQCLQAKILCTFGPSVATVTPKGVPA